MDASMEGARRERIKENRKEKKDDRREERGGDDHLLSMLYTHAATNRHTNLYLWRQRERERETG